MLTALKNRLSNLAWSTVIFFSVLLVMDLFGVLVSPLSEYAFWYMIGAVVGLPLFLAYDYKKLKNAKD